MLGIRTPDGTVAGFIGRARPGAGPGVPKYLNGPETATFNKGDLLSGLNQARRRLARGAIPVIVEGPFDAIAVTAADPGRYAGMAPCGTALTSHQVAALADIADVRETGTLVALDGDTAGHHGAVKAYGILRTVTAKMTAADLRPVTGFTAGHVRSRAGGMMGSMTAQTVPWLAEKAPTSLVGAAGEHYCMTQLLLRGCLAALTPRGAPDADILVLSRDGAITAEVQVKARSGRSGRGLADERETPAHRPRPLVLLLRGLRSRDELAGLRHARPGRS